MVSNVYIKRNIYNTALTRPFDPEACVEILNMEGMQ